MLSTYRDQYEQALKEARQVSTEARILVVDDNIELLEELYEMLSDSGYEVKTVSDSEGAFNLALVLKPQIVLMDLKMQPLTGFQVASEIRNSYALKDVPIIAMTGFFTEKEHILMMKLCGIKSFMLKPVDPRNLIAKIEFALGNRGEDYYIPPT